MSFALATTPAEAGAQLGDGALADVARRHGGLSIWAPGFAGAVRVAL
jgi:hypothetical protein